MSASVLERVRKLPGLPATVLEVLRLLADDDAMLDHVARAIAKDPALAARILRVANSPFYGLARTIASVKDAITVIGLRNARTLVTSAAVMNRFAALDAEFFEARAFWRHAVAVACCARRIARTAGADQEWCATAGLLHDLGCLALLAVAPVEYRAAVSMQRAADCWPMEAERATLGTDHAEAGAVLIAHWRLPEAIADAVAFHHAPTATSSMLACVVHVADAMCHAMDFGRPGADLVPLLSHAAWTRTNVARVALRTWLQDLEHDMRDASAVYA